MIAPPLTTAPLAISSRCQTPLTSNVPELTTVLLTIAVPPLRVSMIAPLASVPPLTMAVPPEETISVPPLDTVAPNSMPPDVTFSMPPRKMVVPLAVPPHATIKIPPLPTVALTSVPPVQQFDNGTAGDRVGGEQLAETQREDGADGEGDASWRCGC